MRPCATRPPPKYLRTRWPRSSCPSCRQFRSARRSRSWRSDTRAVRRTRVATPACDWLEPSCPFLLFLSLAVCPCLSPLRLLPRPLRVSFVKSLSFGDDAELPTLPLATVTGPLSLASPSLAAAANLANRELLRPVIRRSTASIRSETGRSNCESTHSNSAPCLKAL